MAQTNYERVGRVLETLKTALKPYVVRELKAAFQKEWAAQARSYYSTGTYGNDITDDPDSWDVSVLLNLMIRGWNDVFSRVLGNSDRSIVFELRDYRNKWAHQQPFSADDAYRVYDDVERLLGAIASPLAAEVKTEKEEMLRQRYEQRAKKIVRVAVQAKQGLKGWRDIIAPLSDVASGKFVHAEFAADLWEVHLNRATAEYGDAREFYRRTYITQGIATLLRNAVARLAGNGGDPVIELQTNFGGGKTHSMLGLYHLFSDVPIAELSGVEGVVEGDVSLIPRGISRAVIVGNKIPPSDPIVKEDGTKIQTLWGEIAYQLGGVEGYRMVEAADKSSTNPGDALTELFNRYAPCLILIDEWVAYARELYTKGDLPAGSFDTQFTFAQTLSESAKNARQTLLVVSIPASDNEIGGQGGQEATKRLQNVLGRVQSPWQPASKEEAFEIVRRRLFQPLQDHDGKDGAIKAFGELYRSNGQDFGADARELEYERRMQRAYPIHPELFDQLYETWSTIDRFQRTRGVLRLMATVVHSLWSRNDPGLMILPSSIPLDDPNVRGELTKFLDPQWSPIIDRDIDGEDSLPNDIDKNNTNLGRFSATRKVARTVFMATAPIQKGAHRGIDEKTVKIGCVQPGENVAVYGDALRRLSDRATYLYSDTGQYWYSDQPTVRRLAEDRAQQQKTDDVHAEIVVRLQAEAKEKGDFARVHPAPPNPSDVIDDSGAALVLVPPEHTHIAKAEDSSALRYVREVLSSRGTGPRLNQNTLVFLAADQARYDELENAARFFLAWASIVRDADELQLAPFQKTQAENQKRSAESTLKARIPETYQWLIVPSQANPRGLITYDQHRLQANEQLSIKVGRKLHSDEKLMTVMNGSRLKLELDRIPLWRGNHVAVGQVKEDFARYLYLPRLARMTIVHNAIEDGVSRVTWRNETFAVADSYDEQNKRYLGLRGGELLSTAISDTALIVQPEIAALQLDAEKAAADARTKSGAGGDFTGESRPKFSGSGEKANGATSGESEPNQAEKSPKITRFFATTPLKPLTPGSQAGQIAEEVIQHLLSLPNATVKVTLEIEATVPGGIPEDKQRVISENCKALKVEDFGLEEE